MKVTRTFIKDLIILEPKLAEDHRGWFIESFNKKLLNDIGLKIEFIQDNHSLSKEKSVLRGLHLQTYPYAQTKLIRCTRGKIWDVAIDLRKTSKTYLKWFGIELSEKNRKQLFIPQGFAHGFLTLEKNSEVQYKVDNLYNKISERTIKYNDPDIGIEWPLGNYILSEKDQKAQYLKELDIKFE